MTMMFSDYMMIIIMMTVTSVLTSYNTIYIMLSYDVMMLVMMAVTGVQTAFKNITENMMMMYV